jgi:catechol 2,3-dioxygenase-like lactoylglutathione lyase family enzyme
MGSITGVHHFSFSVTNLERTIEFYKNVLGVDIRSKGRNKYDTLGTALFGTKWGVNQPQADLKLAFLQLGDNRIEFIEYVDPMAQPYHKNPSIAGSAHLALRVDNIEEVRERLEAAGVEFHAPIGRYVEEGKGEMKWCYFRDPDGIVLELVQQEEP